MAGRTTLLEDPHRGEAVGRIAILAELLEHDVRPVVEFDAAHGAGLVVDMDLFEERNEGQVRDGPLMVLDPAGGLGGAVLAVEGHPWRAAVEHARATRGDG